MTEGISMADRILVISKRPGQISLDFAVDFAQSETISPLKRRDEPLFKEYFNKIWRELDLNGQ